MLGLTPLGIVHTALSLVALIAGLLVLIRHREISPQHRFGKLYIVSTVLVCLTGFPIMEHGALMNLIKQQGGAYGAGVEYAYTMVHKAPHSAKRPQVVPAKAGH